jgi:hypothetical protein
MKGWFQQKVQTCMSMLKIHYVANICPACKMGFSGTNPLNKQIQAPKKFFIHQFLIFATLMLIIQTNNKP